MSDEIPIEDVSRRTRLAHERTQLAWNRTGLTAFAVSLGVGRVLPELNGAGTQWPYVILGVGFALYGVGMMAYGGIRKLEPERELGTGSGIVASCFSIAGALLGVGTALLIAFT